MSRAELSLESYILGEEDLVGFVLYNSKLQGQTLALIMLRCC